MEKLYDEAGRGSTTDAMQTVFVQLVENALTLCHQYLVSAVAADSTRVGRDHRAARGIATN